ncbi:MAG: cytochrome b/b6 domain-containing protein [Actinomycetota bacterium]|nr:cytochrome b/b6 domain-containing protein [Actinomycetota bacterium]
MPDGGKTYLHRFSRSERAVHWIHAAAFFILLGSGLVLYLPSLASIGNRPFVKDVHLYTAIAWALALLAVVLLGDRKGLRRTLNDLDGFDLDDRLWLRRYPTTQGRFNAGQKLNAAVTAAFAVLFAVSGILLWYGERDTRFRFAGTIVLHDGLMWISLVLLAGHLYLSVIYPRTRHSLRGIVRGDVELQWAWEHHPKWVQEVLAGGHASTKDKAEL